MKATQLDKNLFPNQLVVKAYEDVGQEYDETIQDRVYGIWYPLVTADPVKDQEIEKKIPQMYRIKDSKGEWLFYNVSLYGHDWQGNRKDFSYIEGRIVGYPEFDKRIEPSTRAVIPGTTQVSEVKKIYTIPFSKKKIEEISQYFTESLSCIIVHKTSGRKYSCSLEEFRDMGYDELLNLKTGYTEYMRSKMQTPQLQKQGR